MAIRVTCLSCDEKLSLSDDLRGKKILCRNCGKSVTVPGAQPKTHPDKNGVIAEKRRSAIKSSAKTPAKAKRYWGDDDDDDDDDVEDETSRKKRPAAAGGSQKGVLLVAGGGGLAILIGVVIFLILGTGSNPRAKNDPPVAQIPGNNTSHQDPVTLPPNKDSDPKPDADDGKKDAPKETAPEPIETIGTLSGEQVYQRLLKSTAFIVSSGGTPPDKVAGKDGKSPTLVGTKWTGSETLPGFGKLDFWFSAPNVATKTDAKITRQGNFELRGNQVSITFQEGVYKGSVNGDKMSGTASNGSQNWEWTVTKTAGASGPPPPGKAGPSLGGDGKKGPPGGGGGVIPWDSGYGEIRFQAPPGGRVGNVGNIGNIGNLGIQGGIGGKGGIGPGGVGGGAPNFGGKQGGPVGGGQLGQAGGKGQGQGGAAGAVGGGKPISPSPLAAAGSGVLVNKKHRLVLTNIHVVGDDPKSVRVHFPEFDSKGELIVSSEHYLKKPGIAGKVVAKEERADIALVKLESLPGNVRPVPLATSRAKPGSQVHSVGNPGASRGLWIYTPGKVRQVYKDKWSVKDEVFRDGHYDAMILETDSAINAGDSGGPLVNERGALVGIAHGGHMRANNFSIFIEASECRALIEKYFKSIGETWTPEADSVAPGEINITQLSDWMKKLSSPDMNTRVLACQTLGNLGGDASLAYGAIFDRLKDDHDLVRRLARDALEKVPPHKGDVAMLARTCEDDNEPMETRLLAARALCKLGTVAKPAVPVLMELIKDSNEDLRRACFTALLAIGPQASDLPELVKIFKSASPEAKRQALEVVALMGHDAQNAVPMIAAFLKSPDRLARIQAGKTLAALGPAARDAVKPLTDALADPDRDVALQAARALIKLDEGKSALAFLATAIKTGSSEQRLASAQALGDIGAEAKVAAKGLVDALDDDIVRPGATEALIKIGKGAVPAVSARLKALVQQNASAKARLACIDCLGQIGVSSPDAIFALRYAFSYDRLEENRLAALEAGKKVDGKK